MFVVIRVIFSHGLRTPIEGINQKKSENLGRCGRQNMLWPLKNWEWELIFGHAVKVISSPGVRSPWFKIYKPWVIMARIWTALQNVV